MVGCKFYLSYLQRADETHIVRLSSCAGFSGMKGQRLCSVSIYVVTGLSTCFSVERAEARWALMVSIPARWQADMFEAARLALTHKEKMLKSLHLDQADLRLPPLCTLHRIQANAFLSGERPWFYFCLYQAL
jgi:hypothetical protein